MTQTILLKDIIETIIDYRGKTPKKLGGDWSNSGYRALSAKNIENGKIKNIASIRYVDESLYGKWMKEEINRGDILLTSEAPLGQPLFWNREEKIVLGQRLFAIRAKRNIVDPNFLYAYISSPAYQAELEARATGSTVKGIRQAELIKTRLLLPPLSQQKRIGNFIRAIDEKIELNRKMNETLEEMGQALFRHYFIDNPEAEKWEGSNISKIADNVRESAKPPFSPALRYVALEHFTPRTLALYDSTSADNATSSKTRFKKHDILFGKLRPYFHKVAIAPFDGICSTDILVIRPKQEVDFSFVSFFMSQKSLIDYTTQASEGTRMPRTSWANICNYSVALPPNELLQKFNEEAKPLIENMLENAQQIQTLAALRDILLPRLISGKIRV